MHSSGLPKIKFGKHLISRLITGSNTLNGGSHLSRFVNNDMRSYFTDDNVMEHLKHCIRNGINAWQSGHTNIHWLKMLKEQGEDINFLTIWAEEMADPDALKKDAEFSIGIAHHGEFTDRYFKSGKMDIVKESCKKIRQTGAMVGISTHIPDVLAYVLDKGWDIDYFMCCVYERHRSREELKRLLGDVPIPVGEVYLESDPGRMFSMMKQTELPCLAFKILAAGRLCDRQETVKQAFEITFKSIKPNDAVIVGMYPKYEDQVAINAEYVRQFSSLSRR